MIFWKGAGLLISVAAGAIFIMIEVAADALGGGDFTAHTPGFTTLP